MQLKLQADIISLPWVLGMQIRSSVRHYALLITRIPLAPCDKLTIGASSIFFLQYSCKIILLALTLEILAIRVWSQFLKSI